MDEIKLNLAKLMQGEFEDDLSRLPEGDGSDTVPRE